MFLWSNGLQGIVSRLSNLRCYMSLAHLCRSITYFCRNIAHFCRSMAHFFSPFWVPYFQKYGTLCLKGLSHEIFGPVYWIRIRTVSGFWILKKLLRYEAAILSFYAFQFKPSRRFLESPRRIGNWGLRCQSFSEIWGLSCQSFSEILRFSEKYFHPKQRFLENH